MRKYIYSTSGGKGRGKRVGEKQRQVKGGGRRSIKNGGKDDRKETRGEKSRGGNSKVAKVDYKRRTGRDARKKKNSFPEESQVMKTP